MAAYSPSARIRNSCVAGSLPSADTARFETNQKRRREGRSTKLSATVKEVVADAKVEIPQEEVAEAGPGPPRSGTSQDGLTSASGQRTYDHAIREFVAWHCSEPRLAFSRIVVLRYRIRLEQRGCAPATVNPRLAAVRRIAYEAADAGRLSPELAPAFVA